jgi:hypothetical protein
MSAAPEAVSAPDPQELARLSRRSLAALRRAGRQLVAELEGFGRAGRHPVADLAGMAGARFVEAERYPQDSVADAARGFSWFYHAHPGWAQRPWEEHGHFHCFVDSDRMARRVRPLAAPEDADPLIGGCVHLVGVSIDRRGVPTTLFAPNRWVTNEWMYAAGPVAAKVASYAVEVQGEFAAASRWLGALLRMLQPAIARLLDARDRRLAAHRALVGSKACEDRDLEIAAFAAIDLDAWMDAIDLASARQRDML